MHGDRPEPPERCCQITGVTVSTHPWRGTPPILISFRESTLARYLHGKLTMKLRGYVSPSRFFSKNNAPHFFNRRGWETWWIRVQFSEEDIDGEAAKPRVCMYLSWFCKVADSSLHRTFLHGKMTNSLGQLNEMLFRPPKKVPLGNMVHEYYMILFQ